MSNSEDRFYGDMETIDVLEAGCVYLMMKKEYNVSRNSRVIWLLENLNKTITFVDRCNLDNCTEELTVISVIPLEQPAGWNYETSLKCKYLVTSNTSIFYLSHKYRIVYCLDVSPSLSAVDIQRGEVMIDEMFLALRHSLEGLVHSFKIPGSCATFYPQIYVTVIAHTPFFTTPAQQILVQGWEITNCNIEIFLKLVKQQLEQLEDVVAEVSGIAHDRQESVKAVSEEVAGEHFEEPNDIKQPQHENIPMVSPDLGFINMLRYGMLALRFLPDSGISNLVIITDGIIAIPDVHVFDSVLNQLRSATIACSFLHIGSLFHPHCCTGMVPYADLMHFISVATLGTYMNTIPDFDSGSQNDMNIYHTAFLTWSFHKNKPDMFMQCLNPEDIVTDWHVRNYSFYGSQDPQLHRKKQLEGTLNTSLSIFLYCRLKEGFCPKTINICDTSVEMRLVLPWKNHVNFEYYLKSPWPMNNAHTGSVHYCIYIEAPYSFLHDITCLSKKDFESAHRQAVVTRFWATFKNLSQSDKMIVQLNSFFTTPAVYVTPETVRNGMPVFYLNANSPISCSSDTSSNFIQYWRVLLLLDPNMWQKWLHTQSFGIILQHDRPLPKHLHLANTSGRFQTVQCRQAAAALYSLLKNWSSFVLVENQSYVKFISGSNEKPPTSYYVIHVASKPPYVLVNLQFLVGTPACIRHQVVQQVKETIGQLTFPQRPSVKEDHARKVSVGKRVYKHSPVSRTWSDINCCVMLRMPVEKILIRYERVPSDFTTVVFPDGTQPLMHGKHTMNCSGTSNSAALLTTLSRYLHHWRWVWSAQAGPNSSLGVPAIARVLSTITKIRLREGFNFAHSSSGIINMVLEVEMKGDEVNRGISVQNTHTCVVQYILFPPHITSVSNKDSSSEEGTDVVTNETNGDAELEGELKIITECWIEPQHGLAVNNPPERSYMDNLPYHKLADAICNIDAECISTLLTFEHLSLMCREEDVVSPLRISNDPPSNVGFNQKIINYLNGCNRSILKSLTSSDERIQSISFPFNMMNVLPKCQQAELLLSMFIQDINGISPMDVQDSVSEEDSPNNMLLEMLLDLLKTLHNKELYLNDDDTKQFFQLLQNRNREDGVYPLPIPTRPEKEKKKLPTGHGVIIPPVSEIKRKDVYPKWKCFLKGISITHVMLTFIPASFNELKKLMITGKDKNNMSVNIVKLQQPEQETESKATEQSSEYANESVETNSSDEISVSAISDITNALNEALSSGKLPGSFINSDENSAEVPFRVRASSLDTVTKHMKHSVLNNLFTGSLELKSKHGLVSPSLDAPVSASSHFYISNVLNSYNISKPKSQTPKRKPKYGSITLPIYMYDCPIAVLLEALVYKESSSGVTSDLYENLRHIFTDTHIHTKSSQVDEKDPSIVSSPEVKTKNSNSESKSEDSDSSSDKPTLKQHCKIVCRAFNKCFVYSAYKSLYEGYDMHAPDIKAAVSECEETLIQIDITSFIMTVCGHLKCLSAINRTTDQLLCHTDQENRSSSNVNISPNDQEESTIITGSDDSLKPTSLKERCTISQTETKLSLTQVKQQRHCQDLQQLHQMIKDKFKDIITMYFKPVPSNPLYYYCEPDFDKLPRGVTSFDIDLDADMKSVEVPVDVDNIPFPPDMEFHTEQRVPASWEGHTVATPDDACTSLISNMDSDSVSELEVVNVNVDLSPLFLHLTCSVNCNGLSYNSAVQVLPTCLVELLVSVANGESELNLSGLHVTLNVSCLTLPSYLESVVSGKTTLEMRNTSFCSSSPVPTEGTASLIGSPQSSVASNRYNAESTADRLNHLADYQHKAVTNSIDEIEWLLRDERAAFLLDIFPLQENTLDFIAKHVASSPSRSSCLQEKVPLQFVFNPTKSMETFIKELSSLNITGYRLLQCDQYYYLAKDKIHSTGDDNLHNIPFQTKCSYRNLKLANRDMWPDICQSVPGLISSDEHGIPQSIDNTTILTNEALDIDVTMIKRKKKLSVDSDSEEDSMSPVKRRKDKMNVFSKRKIEQIKWVSTSSHVTASPSLSLVAQDNQSRSSPSLIRSHSLGTAYVSCDEALREDISERENSPTYLLWQRKQQGTPGFRSEVSSLVESGQWTEDGYDGDSSDSADECDWLQELETRRPSLPNFWLVMKVKPEAVITYFHCRFIEMGNEKVKVYREVQKIAINKIKELCKLVNQMMLLQNLNETRMCDQLLEPETGEDLQHVAVEHNSISHKFGHQLKYSDDGTDNEACGDLIETENKFPPGWFACSVVWETHFSLHPRLKTGPGKPGFSRGIQALRAVLTRFSVNNRKNMFVYQDNAGNVFYLRLHENMYISNKLTPTGLGKSDTEDNSPGHMSRSSSINSLSTAAKKQAGCLSEDTLSQLDEVSRRKSFGEKDAPINSSHITSEGFPKVDTVIEEKNSPKFSLTQSKPMSNEDRSLSNNVIHSSNTSDCFTKIKSSEDKSIQSASSQTLNSGEKLNRVKGKLFGDHYHLHNSSEGLSPCVTPQPQSIRPEDTVVLRVHGISDAGPEVKADLVQVLQNRLDDAILEVLSVMLARNPMCKLTPADVHFIQKPSHPPESVIQFTFPSHALSHIQALEHYLRQNILQFLHIPKYTDTRSEYHFQDYSKLDTVSERVPEGSIFLYNQSPSSGSKGIACIAMAVVDSNGNIVKHLLYPKPAQNAYEKDINEGDFHSLTCTELQNNRKDEQEKPGLLEFRIWKQGRVNLEYLTQKIKAAVRHALWDLITEYCLLTAPLTEPLECDEPSPSKGDLGDLKNKEVQSTLIEILKVSKGSTINKFESGEKGSLHRVLLNTMKPWLEFANELGVPAVKKYSVKLATKHSAPIMVREVQNLVLVNASDSKAVVFQSSKQYSGEIFVPYNVSENQFETEVGSTFLIVGRNLTQWKACVTDNGIFDSDSLHPKAQKCFQKFTPLLESQEKTTHFVPRQRFLLALLNELQITIYIYNWSKDRIETLSNQVKNLSHWLSARSSFLRSVTAQKLGLFNNQDVGRKRHLMTDSKNSNTYMTHVTDLDQLVKFSVGGTVLKDPASRRHVASHTLNEIIMDVFRDTKPSYSVHKSSSFSDPVCRNVQQLIEARNLDRREDRKKLYIMWQTRGATPNIPLSEDIIHLFKSHSRVIHYCLTPLLFLPRWRIQSAATRDHLLSLSTSAGQSPKNEQVQQVVKDPEVVSTSSSETQLHYSSEEKWHHTLCADFVNEYQQYLQTLGFIPIQTQKKGHKAPNKTTDVEDSNKKVQQKLPKNQGEKSKCYLQKSFLGGILLFEIYFSEPFFVANLHALECSRLTSKTSSRLISQFTLSFLDECDKIKILMHLHSFTYDYHLRSITSYVSERGAILKQGYHLTHFLDDFMKYYPKAPNFARNLVYAEHISIPKITTPPRQLFLYLLGHEKVYKMEVFRMVPVRYEVDTTNDNEYVLVQMDSTPHITYKDAQDRNHTDDFNITLIVSYDSALNDGNDKNVDQCSLHLKYYIILTSRRELYPKLEIERKLGKFCTVSSVSHEPRQSVSSDEQSDTQHNRNGSLIIDNESQLVPLACGNQTDTQKDMNVSSQAQIRQESVNYLGYYSSHEQLMQQLILELAANSCDRINNMVAKGMVDCRTHMLWNKLQCLVKESPNQGLTYAEFCELCELAIVEPLSHLDPRLTPLLCQPASSYEALGRILVTKYVDHYRYFESPDGNMTYIVVLHPRYLEAFMMLSIDSHTSRADLCAVYRKAQDEGHTSEQLEFCQADIRSLVEGFVNACCYHLWVGLI